MGLITGEAVTVLRPTASHNALGDLVLGIPREEPVADVVVAPGATSDLDATRPEGVSVAYTLCFPKTYAGELRGCSVVVRGKSYRVVGSPQRYTGANTPGEWNLTAEVEAADG